MQPWSGRPARAFADLGGLQLGAQAAERLFERDDPAGLGVSKTTRECLIEGLELGRTLVRLHIALTH